MIPTQNARTSAPPVADVRDGATSRTGAAGLVIAPDTSPARSTQQECTRCLRPGAIKVTVKVGARKWLFCQLCVSRGDKTTTLATDTGRASVATIASIGLYGTVLAALAAATGKLGWVVDQLPFTPTPNGFSVLCLLVLAAGCWWQLSRPAQHEKWPAGAEPLAGATWPDLDPDEALPPLLGSEPKRVRS